MDIRNCISELLVLHDCVIIPGFGGFIGNYSPARIDPVHHSFLPPGKKLLFNVNLKQNDGLLANNVADSFGVSYADACKMIDELAEECRHTLKSGKSFLIPSVGRLTQGREGNLQFEQDKTINLLPDAFGLTSFISPPVGRANFPDRSDRKTAVPAQGAIQERSTLSRSLKWAAMLAIPIGAVAIIGVTQFDKIKSSQVSDAGILSSVFSRFSSTSLVEKKEAPANAPDTFYQEEAVPSVFDAPTNDPSSGNPESEAGSVSNDDATGAYIEPAAITNPEPVQEVTISPANTGDPFAIIVGAFKSKENALKFVSELKQRGIQASIFDKSRGGLYRVTIGTFEMREEAEQLLSSSKSGDFSGAWLLAK